MPIPFVAIGAAAAKAAGPVTIGAVSAIATNTVTNALGRAWKEGRDRNPGQTPDWFTNFGDTVFNYQPPPLPPVSTPQLGQCDALYNITISLRGQTTTFFGSPFRGPVSPYFVSYNSVSIDNKWQGIVRVIHKDINGNIVTSGAIFQTNVPLDINSPNGGKPEAPNFGISRVDHLPDNCGNEVNVINNYYYNTINNTTINLPPLPSVEAPELPSFQIPKTDPFQSVRPLDRITELLPSPEYEDEDINQIRNNLDIALDRLADVFNRQQTDLEATLDAINSLGLTLVPSICRFNPDNNGEPGGGGSNPVTITVPYVREIDGERNIYQSQIQVIGNIGNIIDYLTDSAELALDPVRTITAKKILAILGGETFWDFETIDGEIYASKEYNPEEYLRDISDLAYTIESNGDNVTNLESKELISRSLPSFFSAISSVNYIRSGQWKFPTEVPDTIVERDPETPLPFTVTDITLHDSQDYQQWFMQQFDEIIGNWHQKIEIEDNDLLEEGNQSQTVILHSIADALTEILTQNITTNIYAKTLINMQTRALMELAATKAESVVANYGIDAITDYLGADIQERKINLPLLIKQPKTDSPNEFNITEFLKEDAREIVIKEYKGKNNFQFSLISLLQGAAIIKAALTRKAPGSAEEMLELIKREIGLVGEDNADSEFNEFMEQVEEGFNVYRPNDNKPYGRDYDQRPRLIANDPIVPDEGGN